MARKGGKIMIKNSKSGSYIEIYARGKEFSGRCYRPEVADEMVNSYKNGYGFSLENGDDEITIHGSEIINFFLNGFVVEKPTGYYNILDTINVSGFSELKIDTTDVITQDSEEEIKGIGRLAISEKVRQWAKVRKLDTANPKSQLLKGFEELSELSVGVNKQQHEKIVDSMGDIQVVLIILAEQLGIDYEQSLEYAYEQIKDRKGMMIDGTFVKYADLSEENKKILDNEEN